ncbi:HlyC/CorC family transporter [Hyphomicrobiales bacterium]|nr:HlyC/CorC family transporter [Hyphomicrobiales bacterium]
MFMTLAIFFGSILGLLIVSAFFSGSETALTAVSKARIRHLADEGNKKASEVEKLISQQDKLISTLLLGNNLVNILASALTTSLFISLFGDVGVIVATIVMTSLVVIFAEILPKIIALKYSDMWSLKAALPIKITIKILGPLANLAQKASSYFVRNNNESKKLVDAHDELRGQISIHHQEGEVKKGDRDMLGAILDLPDITVEDVMVHRKNITAIDINEINEKIIKEILSSPFTRIPVWEENTDNFIGLLHIKSLTKEAFLNNNDFQNINIRKILSKPWFVPETTSLKEQLNAFLDKKLHMALVVDEYGSIMGLITLEDILEEIVGQIDDEHDVETEEVISEFPNSIDVDGGMSIRDLNRNYGWDIPDTEATTLAGLIIHESQTIPKVGSAYIFYGFKFKILSRTRNQITSLRVEKV